MSPPRGAGWGKGTRVFWEPVVGLVGGEAGGGLAPTLDIDLAASELLAAGELRAASPRSGRAPRRGRTLSSGGQAVSVSVFAGRVLSCWGLGELAILWRAPQQEQVVRGPVGAGMVVYLPARSDSPVLGNHGGTQQLRLPQNGLWGIRMRQLVFRSRISIQSLSHVRLFATPWTAAGQASLSITDSGVYSNSCPSSR